ncbi:PEP-CTERM system TPR-repeat protein PrsT [Oryzomonas sagensis]|uniref:PEP-CTERM system TPR-repeat protein PrsT n=1 Tax=Oryzomonas sagensis TaxID=2603857 RepID=A0ABQ6TKD9_9BACT|nr:XrtA/PEP-CTERM system TPR-repeat protein PrsT [Oryzomonas sagensis]KAB0668543.1 PEP-CTERM system TPR-repeat protein PrsT [Oryzomonas sagensis]
MLRIFLVALVLFVCSACGGKSKEELFSEGLKQLNAANSNAAVVLFRSALEKDENYSDARFQLAKAYAALGKREQAEREFTKVLKQNPSRDEVLLELAKLMVSAKKTDEAFKLAGRYLAKHPGSAECLETLGLACAASRRYDEAASYLLQAIKADPRRSKTKLELAALYVAAGKEPKARGLLDEIVAEDPKNPRAYYMLAAMEKSAGNADKALEIYQKILAINRSEVLAGYKSGLIRIERGELDQAEKTSDEMIKTFPKRSDGYRLKGLVSYQRKKYAEAAAQLQNSIKITPTSEGYYFLGLCYYNLGELETALSQFRKILDVVPTSRQARLMTGAILLTQKRTDDAITEINKVLQQNDKDAVAHNMLGNAYMAKGMFDEGMQELNRATKADPKMVDAYQKKGYYYLSRGKNTEGEMELATAVKMAPDSLNSRLLLASYYMRKGNTPKALSVLKSGLTGKKSDAPLYNALAALNFSESKQAEGIRNLQKAKEIDPLLPASYQSLATYYAVAGNYDKAIDEYGTLYRNDPHNAQAMLGLAALYEIKGDDRSALVYYQKAKDANIPAAFLAQASHHLKKKETDKAIKVLDDAIKVNPHDVSALEMKGRILVADKKYKEAVKMFDDVEALNPEAGIVLKVTTYVAMKNTAKAVEQARKVIAKYPGSARGYVLLGSVYENQKNYPGAIREVKNGLRVDPDNANALLFLGKLFETQKDYDQAMVAYVNAERKKPDYVPAIYAQGAIFDLKGKQREAVGKYRLCLEKSHTYVPALNNLAYLCAEGYGKKEEALRLAIGAFKLEPGNPGVMDTLGYALLKNRRIDEAKKVLEKAATLLPHNPTIAYHLALAYRTSGDKINAVRTLQKALTLGDFADANAAKSMLSELRK